MNVVLWYKVVIGCYLTYGMQAFAFLAAGIVSLCVYFSLKRTALAETTLKPAIAKVLGIVVTLTVVICMGYMLYHEFARWGIFASMASR